MLVVCQSVDEALAKRRGTAVVSSAVVVLACFANDAIMLDTDAAGAFASRQSALGHTVEAVLLGRAAGTVYAHARASGSKQRGALVGEVPRDGGPSAATGMMAAEIWRRRAGCEKLRGLERICMGSALSVFGHDGQRGVRSRHGKASGTRSWKQKNRAARGVAKGNKQATGAGRSTRRPRACAVLRQQPRVGACRSRRQAGSGGRKER